MSLSTYRLSRRALLTAALLPAALLGARAAHSQIVPKDAGAPVIVLKGQGAFAQKLNGAVMPTGKGWKATLDPGRRFQLMLPERWKVTEPLEGGDIRLTAAPPGAAKEPTAQLQVIMADPSEKDPLEVDEDYALGFAEDLAQDKSLLKRQYKSLDAGYVLARGLKFALAGGTLEGKKKATYRQVLLVYVGEDRVLWLQFTAPEKEFEQYQEDVVKIFASYQNLGVKKIGDDF